jgi:hypothetical protein
VAKGKYTMGDNNEMFYKEGCNAVLHFSTCVMNIRTVTIAQGFAILTAAMYFIKEGSYLYSLLTTLFGFLFTAVLYRLHWNYLEFWKDSIRYAAEIEHHLSAERTGPWNGNLESRERRLSGRINRLLVERGTTILILTALVTAFTYSLLKLLGILF